MSQDNTPKTQAPAETAASNSEDAIRAEAASAPETCADAAVSDLAARIAALEQKNAELQDNWLRAKAETENVRRRAQEEIAKAHKFGIEKFAGELLAVKDSLEAALASEKQTADNLRGGVELTLKQLISAFEKSALKEINPLGGKFDPHLHQAIQMVASDSEANTIVQVLQKGCLIAERVLRPAMVLVSSGKAD
ncbi:MAG: nucleotide exchange factor GrpE [Zoogloeaceae bacterium]|jgi:molecular chaperone GrpE|nr:nucleotide exchange factor GrpE [Zoogloeaceae bacterium]